MEDVSDVGGGETGPRFVMSTRNEDRLGSTRIDSDRPDQLNMFPLQFEGDKEIPKEDNFFCCTDLAKILGLGIAFSIFALKAGKTGNC